MEAQQARWAGEILLVRPVSFWAMSAGAAAIAVFLILFMWLGSYTRRTTVAGQLVPDLGLVKVYPSQSGVILAKLVTDGQKVKREQPLYVLSVERHSAAEGKTQELISAQVRARLANLRTEISNQERVYAAQKAGTAGRMESYQSELRELEEQIIGQHQRVALALEAVRRYEDLYARSYVSQDQLNARRAELVDARSHLDSQYRERALLEGRLHEQAIELRSLPLKHASQTAEIERAIAAANQELVESEARRRIVVVAPASGIATAVTGELGQIAASDRPMLSIVPARSRLLAHFLVPTRAVGFLRSGNEVRVRFQAFPFQKFGYGTGRVAEVARVALSDAEITGSNAMRAHGEDGRGQPLYRVVVSLQGQSILAYGEEKPLQAGMLVEADILQENRRLYEWMLEPLYSVTGKL
jgi:membrane fusion protein